jgi:hypothetical protein
MSSNEYGCLSMLIGFIIFVMIAGTSLIYESAFLPTVGLITIGVCVGIFTTIGLALIFSIFG